MSNKIVIKEMFDEGVSSFVITKALKESFTLIIFYFISL